MYKTKLDILLIIYISNPWKTILFSRIKFRSIYEVIPITEGNKEVGFIHKMVE